MHDMGTLCITESEGRDQPSEGRCWLTIPLDIEKCGFEKRRPNSYCVDAQADLYRSTLFINVSSPLMRNTFQQILRVREK